MPQTLVSTLSIIGLSALAFFVLAPRQANATYYAYTTIDDPAATTGTQDIAISNNGKILGRYTDATGGHYFVDTNGTFVTIAGSSVSNFSATGINNSGQIAGQYFGTGFQGFVDTNGTFAAFNVPAGTHYAYVQGINDNGQVVGFLDNDTTPGFHSYVDANGTLVTIDAPVGRTGYIIANGINNNGQVTGTYNDAAGRHGFVKGNGTFVTFDDPAATNGTTALGINDNGDVVGQYSDATGTHNFVDSNGAFVTINDPAGQTGTTYATGINDSGQVVGYYTDATGNTHGFVATLTAGSPPPVPEPASLAVLGTGVLGLGLIGRRKTRSGH